MQQYVKNGMKISGKIGIILVILTVLTLVIYFAVSGFEPLHTTFFEMLGFLMCIGLLPLLILSIAWLPLIKVYIQIKRYLRETDVEKQQELSLLINQEKLTVPVARWYYKELHLSQNFLISLPNFIVDREEIKLCKSSRKKRHKNIIYYRVKICLKNGQERILEYSDKRNVKAILNWWENQ